MSALSTGRRAALVALPLALAGTAAAFASPPAAATTTGPGGNAADLSAGLQSSRVWALATNVALARHAEDQACGVCEAARTPEEEVSSHNAACRAFRATELAVLRLARTRPNTEAEAMVKCMVALRQFGGPSDADSYLARRAFSDITRMLPALVRRA